MQKLIDGLRHFQAELSGSQRALFERLAAGQSPETLSITCSDSRINPNLAAAAEVPGTPAPAPGNLNQPRPLPYHFLRRLYV